LRPWVARADVWLLFLLGFVLWLLNHPYQGLWHDARIYALLAAHWQTPEAYARDLFFSFGSQGSSSLFTPVYGALVAWLGLDRGAWWVTLSGGMLWIAACVALARTMLGNGYGARFAVLLGAVVIISYSPNNSTFVLGENFAVARSWAIPLGMISVAALAAQRQGWSIGASLAAAVLHPLYGVWPLALWLLMRVRIQLALALVLMPLVIVFLLGVIRLDLPYARLMTGDWLEFARGAPDIVFRAPLDSRLPHYLVVLVVFWLGAGHGSVRWRALYARLLLLGAGALGLALLVSHAFPVEIVVQGQPWRVMALLLPLAAVTLIDLGQRVWQSSVAGQFLVGVVTALACMGTYWLLGGLCAIALASLMPMEWIEHFESSCARFRQWLGGTLALFAFCAVPNMLAAWEIAGNQWLNPWWTGVEWLQGLLTGGFWHLAALLALFPSWRRGGTEGAAARHWTTNLALILLGMLTSVTLYQWDRRPVQARIEQTCYLDSNCRSHPFREWIAPGSVVFWPERELTVWFELGTASYFGEIQATGKLFSPAKFYEWQRRAAFAAAGTGPRHLCSDSVIDWVVLPYSTPGLSPRAVLRQANLYACSDLRAVRSEPGSSRPAS
jgi:hypothetical protein